MRGLITILIVLLLFVATSQANAYWVTDKTPETYKVLVHPHPYWTLSGWVTPAPYEATRTRWIHRHRWVQPQPQPVIIIYPTYPPPTIIYGGCPCWSW